MRRTLRKWSAQAHTWLGLACGAFICVMSVSGAIIAFRPQIEDALTPKRAAAANCTAEDADRAAMAVNEYAPGSRIERIAFPSETNGAWRLQIAGDHGTARLAYDPCSGKVLGPGNVAWLEWTVDLHHNLLAGKTGRRFTGVIGIALLLMSFSGFIVWMQSNPRWRDLRIQSADSTRRLVFDVHRSIGIVAMLAITGQAFTGVWLAYPQTMKAALGRWLPAKAAGKKEKKAKRSAGATISAYLRVAAQAVPDGAFAELKMPDADGKSVQVRMRRAGDLRPGGNNTVTLDPSTAAVLSVERFADLTPLQKVVESVTPLHYGELGGIGYRVLLSVLGLVPLLLFVSGFLIWWIPRRLRAKKKSVELIPETVSQ
jgi:uncharacterized iron-regulated membrane protein